jgi:predicted acyltransferase
MTESTASNRLVALDVFRGLTIALMFTVNNPGTWSYIYDPLEHAKWHGWTPTDWVFPFFLFTVGVSAWFALKKYKDGKAPAALYWKIIKRGTMIFLIGLGLNLFLNTLSSYENLRIMGVLQRIGIAYLIGSLLCVSFRQWAVAIIGGVILMGYWVLMYNTGDATYPFGMHDGAKFLGVENNIVTQVDQWLLGKSHLYKGYDGIPFDPEGLLSTLPAIVTVILGYFTGKLIDAFPNRMDLVKRMFILGIAALALGYLLNAPSILRGLAFPINKPIWSSTYVIFMAGWCLVINAVLILIIDVLNWRAWTKPVLVLGMNSMLAFVISGMYVKTVSKIKFDSSYETVTQKWDNQTVPKRIGGTQKLYEDVFSPMTTDRQLLKDVKAKVITEKSNPSVFAAFGEQQKLSSLFYALFHVVLFWFILWIFYRNNIFLKV